MASWHLFKEGWFTRFMIRRMGAFSVYREGVDRAAVNAAVDILAENRRPLIIFPEGALSRHNDQLMELMDGPSFIARQAAKKRKKQNRTGNVVVLPVDVMAISVYPPIGRVSRAAGRPRTSDRASTRVHPKRPASKAGRPSRRYGIC